MALKMSFYTIQDVIFVEKYRDRSSVRFWGLTEIPWMFADPNYVPVKLHATDGKCRSPPSMEDHPTWCLNCSAQNMSFEAMSGDFSLKKPGANPLTGYIYTLY